MYYKDWHSDCVNTFKLPSYASFKLDFTPEKYITLKRDISTVLQHSPMCLWICISPLISDVAIIAISTVLNTALCVYGYSFPR